MGDRPGGVEPVNYHLYEDSVPAGSVAEADLASNLAAAEWAKGWLQDCATHDRYTIERADGRFSACLIRTVGGQWYAMPKTGFFVAE